MNSKLLLLSLCLCGFLNTYSQVGQDYFFLDEGIEEIEPFNALIPQVESSRIFRIDGFSPSAVKQISAQLDGLHVRELRLFVLTKPGAMVFNSQSVATENENEWSSDMEAWGASTIQRVVIYSNDVFSGKEGILLKQRLESVTGLEFSTQSINHY